VEPDRRSSAVVLDAIYYPYFHPPAAWLRRAALCWNTVYRFLPPDAPPDHADVAELDAELGGVLGELHPSEIYIDVGSELLDWVDASLDRWQAASRGPASETNPLVGQLMGARAATFSLSSGEGGIRTHEAV
jgi:hypothetical protein